MSRRTKGRWRRRGWAIYSRPNLRWGFRVWLNWTEEKNAMLGQEFSQRRKKLTCGPGRSVARGRERRAWQAGPGVSEKEGGVSHTISVTTRDGPWAGFKARPKSFPAAFSYFLFFFLFSFSGFPYFFHIICKFDSNQAKPFS
jgi:hypothetical protein